MARNGPVRVIMAAAFMLLRTAAVPVLGLLVSVMSVAANPPKVQVVRLPREGEVLVSFTLAEALSDEIRTAIHSGLPIKLVYTVDMRRSASAWFEGTIASAVETGTGRSDQSTVD